MKDRVIDTSHWSGKLTISTIASKFAGIITKATESTWYIDTAFYNIWAQITGRGLYRGHYHFYREYADPKEQALHYYRTVQAAVNPKAEFPPILDMEVPTTVLHLLRTLEYIEQYFGEVPIIYTSPSIWRAIGNPILPRYYIWLAQYPYRGWKDIYNVQVENWEPSMQSELQNYFMWQWTAYAPGPQFGVEELETDLNIVRGKLSDYAFMRQPENIPPIAVLPDMPRLGSGKTIVNGLRIRTKPTITAPITGYNGNPDLVRLAKKQNSWVLLRNANKVGWSATEANATKYIEVFAPPPASLPKMVTTVENLRLRKGPGITYDIIAALPARTSVDVFSSLETSGDIWIAVDTPYGAGWCAYKYRGFIYLE